MSAPAAIALLGTSADPPTRGHQVLLEGLLAHFPRVATWASDNPMKRHGAPLEQRAELLEALVRAIGDPRLELAQELSSPWAITTLERAAQRWSWAELVFVVGSDLAGQIPHWKQAATVLQRCRLAIVPRRGWPLGDEQLEALRALGGRVEVLPLEVPASASTEARRQPLREQIPAAVWPLLLQHNLYGLHSPV
ncbi:nicotinate-nucleotide adenylyltransferase [Cyanobium sp. CH-040]|uniref:nicotinate-nucleotide adenylyltransferase n=1 Tax=Cyanobium sp. CH-040 TaxID=2823708 RepID=UPI0020CC83DF|nr:nicotinate-nucleotide adenylyltransferase [Cyanobium sp. CH-040]MCP9928061.1 nicotinate-nucleotide adenylyltransferase [Cyanobium sp. CH-040]